MRSWIQSPLSKISLLLHLVFFLCILVLFPSWYRNSWERATVSVDGKAYGLEEVRSDAPILYSRYQNEYNNLLKSTLGQFAEDKLFQKLAEEKNIPKNEVLRQGFSPSEPLESEIQEIFRTYKSQFQGQSLAEVRGQIVQSIQNQREQEYMEKSYQELVTKYPIQFQFKEQEPLRIAVEKKNNPSLGKSDAKVRIIEFSDFECPYCKRSQDVNKRLRAKYPNEIEWVFRDFPLPFHENAFYAHVAANCAIPQGKYWQAVEMLFENSGNLTPSNVDYLITKAGVSKDAFQACMQDRSKYEKEVREDMEDGQKAGVNGTPAFFINGIFLSGALPFEKFDEIIQKELNR